MNKLGIRVNLWLSIFEIIMGILAIFSFLYLLIKGEDMKNFIVALIAAVSLTLTGVAGIYNYNRNKKIIDNSKKK